MRSALLLTFSVLTALAFLAACNQTVPGLPVDESDPDAELRGKFNLDVLPLLQTTCVSCHGGSRVGINFAGSPDDKFESVYDRAKAWPELINVDEPLNSRIITKGVHEGPTWTDEENAIITDYLLLENQFARPVPPPETNATALVDGPNEIDLGAAGLTGMEGTLLRFDFAVVGSLLQFTAVRILAPSTGAKLKGPVFSIKLGSFRTADPLNSFGEVDLNIAPDEEVQLGGGILYISHIDLVEHPGTPELIFAATEFEPVGTGENTNDPFACRTIGTTGEFEAFQAAFAGANANVCNAGNCHSGGNAAAGLSVAGFDSADPDEIATFCRNVRGKLNITNPAAGPHALIDKANGQPTHVGGAPGAGAWSVQAIAFITAESLAAEEVP